MCNIPLPIHCTYRAQPFGTSFEGRLRSYYDGKCINVAMPLVAFATTELFGDAYQNFQTGKVISSSFKTTRTYHFNRHVFSESDSILTMERDL